MRLHKQHLLLGCKCAIMIGAIMLVLTQSDVHKIISYLERVPVWVLVISFLLVMAAQVISALRSQLYFASIHLPLNTPFVIGLYFTGCLYNSFLPGGISGDGYKIYLLGKLSTVRRLAIFRVLVSERASGLLFLLLFFYLFLFLSKTYLLFPYGLLLLSAAIPVTLVSYMLLTRWLLSEQPSTSLKASPYSFIIQSIAVGIALLILANFHDLSTSFHIVSGFLTLFLLSNVLTVLPISIGGIGIRELAFLYGAPLLSLDPEPGIALGIIYFVLYTLMALNGLFFWHKLEPLFYTGKRKI